ncbi:RTA1 like protein-domain-containing protein [Xylariales sp. PMI_506]|nr:RTA1 like protein-domain-containing protein [Xylariales sp. PMI_506]
MRSQQLLLLLHLGASPTVTGDYTTTEHIIIPGQTNAHVTNPGQTIDIAIPTCVQTITPDANGYVPPGTCGAIWDYYPSFNAAVAFAAIFLLLTVVHIWQAAHYQKKWSWVIIMASIWETAAFASRAISSRFQQSDGIYLVFQIFILLAPLWVNAYAYIILGRMIHFFLPSGSLLGIPAATIGAIFVLLDLVSFVVQLVGGSMAGPTSSAEDQLKAIHIYMGGIGMQQFFIIVFVGLLLAFWSKVPLPARRTQGGGSRLRGVLPLLFVLCASLAMISTRIIYRLVEFSSGSVDNPITSREIYFYLLEATPMVLAILVFNVVHPGKTIDGPGSEMPGLRATAKAAWWAKKGKVKLMDDDDDDEQGHPLSTTDLGYRRQHD